MPTIDWIDALLPLYERPGREPRRSDALRAVVHAGLAVEERRARRRGRCTGREDAATARRMP
jgi:hypothetical protein